MLPSASTVPAPEGPPPSDLGAAAQALLRRWLDEVHLWNLRINLTAVPAEQAWARHVEESLELLAEAAPELGATVLDLGSGAGIPGIPMAVARADLRMTLADADRRKAGFLTHATGLLGIAGRVGVVAHRAEVLGRDPAHREAHDLVVSRATAPAAVLIELALPLVRPGGRLAALVRDAAASVDESEAASRLLGGGRPRAVGSGMLLVDKLEPTADAYPRRTGVPNRRPLG